jgi:hypothetical protein
MLEIAEPRSAIFLLDCNAVQTKRAHLWPKLARKFIRSINLCCVRKNLLGLYGENLIAQHIGRFTEIEVKRRQVVGDHCGLPPAADDSRLGANRQPPTV